MRLVIGLGNPGPQYDGTRHNVGFEVIDRLVAQHRLGSFKAFKRAAVCRGSIGHIDCLLAKPMTFMNASGEAVAALLRFYQIDLAEIIVVHDELDFAPGHVRIKPFGGHGGHNGLRSILQHVGGQDFARVRIGIGKPRQAGRGADYVLARFDPASLGPIDAGLDQSCRAVQIFLAEGLQAAMQQVNHTAKTAPP